MSSGTWGNGETIGVGVLVRAFLGRQLPLQALVRRQAVAGVEVEAAEPAAVAQGVTVVVAVEAVVFLAGQRQAEVACLPGAMLWLAYQSRMPRWPAKTSGVPGDSPGAQVMMLITPSVRWRRS